MIRRYTIGSAVLIAVVMAACSGQPEQAAYPSETTATPVAQTGGVVDSVFPMSEMITRFQAQQQNTVTALGAGSARSRDELVASFIRAVEAADAAALRALRIDQAEFAFLYFPTSLYARPPYQQPPAIQWMLMDGGSIRSERALLSRRGGRPLRSVGYTCGAPVREGGNELWLDCRVMVHGSVDGVVLFGPIIARDGRYKFVSLTNDL
jgi:hypothetical protein